MEEHEEERKRKKEKHIKKEYHHDHPAVNYHHGQEEENYHTDHDDFSEARGDAAMLHHVPWNHLFPKNSYLPDSHALDMQHDTMMGEKFFRHYRNDDVKADDNSDGFINTHHDASPYEEYTHNHGRPNIPEDHYVDKYKHFSPYGHNSPYLGGGMTGQHGEHGRVLSAVHGDLCVGKRNSLCTHDDLPHHGRLFLVTGELLSQLFA